MATLVGPKVSHYPASLDSADWRDSRKRNKILEHLGGVRRWHSAGATTEREMHNPPVHFREALNRRPD